MLDAATQQLGSRIATALHEGRIDIEQPAILGVDQGQLVKASFKRIEIAVVTAFGSTGGRFPLGRPELDVDTRQCLHGIDRAGYPLDHARRHVLASPAC